MAQQKMIVFEPGLPNTPGWTGLSEAKQQWLQEKTSNIKKWGGMEGLASVNGGLELMEVKQGLEDSPMGITDYLKTVYGGHERTGFRKLEDTEDLLDKWPADLVRSVAERGALLLRGTANIGLKDLVNVARELPAPKGRDKKTIDAFIEGKVRDKLKEIKTTRRAGKVLKLRNEDGLKIMFNHDRRVMRAMKGLSTSADRREVLKTVVGWLMEDFAVPGTLECQRLSIPEGMVAKVGRPHKKGREKAA